MIQKNIKPIINPNTANKAVLLSPVKKLCINSAIACKSAIFCEPKRNCQPEADPPLAETAFVLWTAGDSNSSPPRCKRDALPDVLAALASWFNDP